jgi:APA family basic amino acid/polyamine antiporter
MRVPPAIPYHDQTMQVLPQAARQMGVWSATAVVTGEAISLGIFLTPAGMARSLGSPSLLAAVWCGTALMTIAGAICFTELAVRNPHDGGEYLYLRRGFGRNIAFLYGWMAAIVMYPGVSAALCVGLVPYLQVLVPISPTTARLVPALLIIAFGLLNYFGTRLSRGVMSTLNWIKVPLLLGLVGWALASPHASLANLASVQRPPGSVAGAIAGAAVSAFFCFGGWWEAGKIARQVRNPARTLPIAFTGGVLVVTALYLLLSLAFVAVVPMASITSDTAFVAQFGNALFGSAGARVLSACVLVCVIGGLLVLIMAVPRVTYALAREEAETGPLAVFARLNPGGTPANAVLLQTVMALLVLLLGAFENILSFIIFSAVVFLAVTAATLFRSITPVRRWWYPTAPIFFVACSAALALMLLMNRPRPALMGAVIVLAGLPARALLVRASKNPPAPSPALEPET